MILKLLFLIPCYYSFIIRNNIKMNNDNPPKLWKFLNKNLKSIARNWFISRAEKVGIEWNSLYQKNDRDLNTLKYIYEKVNNQSLTYPNYYTQPFHGYDLGNLNWDASLECEAATLSVAVNYWKNTKPEVSQNWLRNNVTDNIKFYINSINKEFIPHNILDIGCSIGVSTEYLYNSFNLENTTGIDLSPYFISMAKLRSKKLNNKIKYYHKNAENTNFHDNSFDLVVCNFIMHELPENATINIIKEIKRILKKNGMIVIVDLSPEVLKYKLVNSKFRKWSFEVTEPHIYGYYKRNITNILFNLNYNNIKNYKNDPINNVICATL